MSRTTWTCVVAIGVTLAGCTDATGPGLDEAPDLPQVESLLFDLGIFGNTGAPRAPELQTGPGLHWAAAAIRVGIANVAVVVHMAVPVATWRAATLQTPTFENNRWHWRFSVSEGGQTYAGHLTGYRDGADRAFEMRITSTALGLTDFLWYTGRAPIGGTSGVWDFFEPEGGALRGRIEWQHPETDVWILTFRSEGGETAGDELSYRVEGTLRRVTYFDASTDQTVEVEWDAVTRAGHLIAPTYNGGAKACWDAMLLNTACPS